MNHITEIWTHERAHLDEICAVFLLQEYGNKKYQDISKAKIVFLPSMPAEETRSPEEREKAGIICVGFGGGKFDEHPSNGEKRKENYCATTLVAKDLDIEDHPSLSKLLRFVSLSDLTGPKQPFDLAELTKLLHGQFPNDPQKVFDWAVMGLKAKLVEQIDFFGKAKKEFESKAMIDVVKDIRGRELKIATIVSDDEQISKFARSTFGGNVAVLIQKQSSGNVQIQTNKRFGIKLYDLVQMIRMREQQLKFNGEVKTKEWKALKVEGKVVGAEEWYFQEASQTLLNGSLTATKVPATQIGLQQIRDYVKIAIDPGTFEPLRACLCKQGKCVASNSKPCPWYDWGLQRCRQIRFEKSQQKKEAQATAQSK